MTGLFVKLDVEYASDDKMIEAGPMAELLYVRGLAFCKKNSASDGKISTAQLAVVAVGIPGAKKAAARLVDVEAWTVVDRGWVVTSWLKRNRSGADIQAQADLASALGIQGNHERWHIGPEGKPSPKCSLCIGLHRQTRSGGRLGYPIGGSSPEVEEETEEETEPKEELEEETEQSSSSSVTGTYTWLAGLPPAAAAALDAFLRWKVIADDPRKPSNYERDLKMKLPREHGDHLKAYKKANPAAEAQELAQVVLGMREADAIGFLDAGAA